LESAAKARQIARLTEKYRVMRRADSGGISVTVNQGCELAWRIGNRLTN